MIDMSTWEELILDVVTEIRLDPRNVRLDISEGVPESDIIQDLFANEKAHSLVEAIAEVGLLTHEVPIVLERDGQFVVVEGNRRVAALKAIQNPYLAPSHQARIAKLAKKIPNRDAIRRITVKKAPSQDDADQLVAALHTGNQRVAWTPTRQAAFFQAQLNAGKSPEALIDQYPTINVRKFITRTMILDLFYNVDYDDESLGDYVRSRRFPVSTLERLYKNDRFLELIGIDVKNATGEAFLASSNIMFKRVATKIVDDIKNKVINTRALNKTTGERYVAYMGELQDLLDRIKDNDLVDSDSVKAEPEAPIRSSDERGEGIRNARGQGGGARSGLDDGGHDSNNSGKDRPKPAPRKQSFLKTENLSVWPGFPHPIHAIFDELTKINIERFPNATLDLLRTFLEKAIKARAELLGEDIKSSSNSNGYVHLSNCLVWLEQHFKDTGKRSLIQPIQKVRGLKNGTFVVSKEHLDAINHNHQIYATSDDVRTFWVTIEGVMKEVLKL